MGRFCLKASLYLAIHYISPCFAFFFNNNFFPFLTHKISCLFLLISRSRSSGFSKTRIRQTPAGFVSSVMISHPDSSYPVRRLQKCFLCVYFITRTLILRILLDPCHKVEDFYYTEEEIYSAVFTKCPYGPTLCGGYDGTTQTSCFLNNVFIYLFGYQVCSTQTL